MLLSECPIFDLAQDENNRFEVLDVAPTNSLPGLLTQNQPKNIPVETKALDVINPTERILLELQEMTTSPSTFSDLNSAEINSTLGVPTTVKLVSKGDKGPNWGPKTKRTQNVIPDESNSADGDAGESANSNQSDGQSNEADKSKESSEADESKKSSAAKNHFPTLAERKAFCPKLISSPIDEDGPLSILVRRKSANNAEVMIPFKCSKDAETRRSSSVEKVSKFVSGVDASEHISEEQAKKRKYQPQVVVEKIDEKSVAVQLNRSDGGLSGKLRARNSSVDSNESSGSKKFKKEK